MTLLNTLPKVSYSGDDSKTSFYVTFVFWETTDLRVVLTVDSSGVETDWVEGTDYDVLRNEDGKGTVTTMTAPATGETLTILSNRNDEQTTSLPLGGEFPSTAVEQMADQVVRLIQQRSEELGRSLKLPVSLSGVDSYLPTPSTEKPILQFKADGTGFEWIDDSPGSASAAAESANQAQLYAMTAQTATTRHLRVPIVSDSVSVYSGTAIRTLYTDYGGTVTDVAAWLTGASAASGPITIDVMKNDASILSTLLTIDDGDVHSKDADTPKVIKSDGTEDFLQYDRFTFDVSNAGDGNATGLNIVLTCSVA